MRRILSALGVVVLALVAVGMVMLMSTSSVRAQAEYSDPYYFLKRQLIWLAISIPGTYALIRIDYHHYQKRAWLIWGGVVVMLALVFVPGIGHEAGGSNRWIRGGPLSLQPSELAKIALVMALSAWMAARERRAATFLEGVVIPCAILGVTAGLIFAEPDFGTTLLTGAVGMAVLYAGGARLIYLSGVALLGGAGFCVAVAMDPVRLGRIMAFLQPEKYPAAAYHLSQSKLAFIRGGGVGVGLGNSIQKEFYLPEAHTDFILAIVGEELGYVATGLIMLLFLTILVCGIVISLRAPDTFGRLLAFGLTLMLVVQAAINIGVVIGCLPTKGLPLPFISYGGSSLMASLACVGILMNIGLHGLDGRRDEHTRIIRDRTHSF